MEKRQKIEREFGVPIPGVILPPSQWTQTALKKLPIGQPLDLGMLFGRIAPVVVDLGCGNGRFVLGSALRHREWDHLAIDILPMVLRYATRRANQRGLANVRFAACDGVRLVNDYLVPESVWQFHCYHPQPYYDPKEYSQRLITPSFLARVHSILRTEGKFFFQTDNRFYWDYARNLFDCFFDFQEQPAPWPEDPQGRTRREILARRKGLPIFRGVGIVRKNLDAETIQGLIRDLPLPTFDAGPRRRDLGD